MTSVSSCDCIREIQCCGANQQVFEGDFNATGRLLTFYLSRELSDLERNRIDQDGAADVLNKHPAAVAASIVLSAVDAVSQFYNCYGGETGLGLALGSFHPFEDVRDALASPLSSDEDAGVENYSHAERSRGLRLSMISRRSAAKPASRVGSEPDSFACASAMAMDSERRRPRGASAERTIATGRNRAR